ncbi:MAG: hypothetical protein HN503_06420 [Flavobacteriales bacterium]|nr:hypothetical protein [Flavobacteriales bacterium]
MRKRETVLTFSGLSLGEHALDYHLDDAFFASYENPDLEGLHCPVKISGSLRKANNMLTLNLAFDGLLDCQCDISNEPLSLPLTNAYQVIVRFGNAFDDSNPDLIILPFGEIEVDLSQLFYELVALSIPMRKVRPDLVSDEDEDDSLDDTTYLSN